MSGRIYRRIGQILSWTATAVWIALCLYVSWQTGQASAGFSWRLTNYLLWILDRFGIRPDAAVFHAQLRLTAHFGVFFVAGFLWGVSLSLSFYGRRHYYVASVLSGVLLCSSIAVLAEVIKRWIPGRHLQWDEAMLNVAGVLCGLGLVSLATVLWMRGRRRRAEKKKV